MQDFLNKYNGKYVGDHQCGSLVRQYWIEVDNTNPPSYPSAKDYWFNPAPPYVHTSSPKPGDIAVYDAHGAFPDGHIAVYVGGEVFEQNADPDGSPAHLFNRANTYLLGYLTKEEEMSTIGEIEFNDLFRAFFGDINLVTEADRKAWVGGESNTVIRSMAADPRFQPTPPPEGVKPYSGPALYVKD